MNRQQRDWSGTARLIRLCCLLASVCFFSVPAVGSAANNDELAFELRPLIPDIPGKESKSYYDYELAPNETEMIAFEIANNTAKSAKFKVNLNRASTNRNGYIDYSYAEQAQLTDVDVDFNDVVSYREKIIEVKPNTVEKVTFDVKMPATSFPGILLGGIYVTKIEESEQTETSAEETSVGLKNKLAYAVAVLIKGEKPVDLKRGIDVERLTPEAVDNQASLILEMVNDRADLIKNVSVDVTIYQEEQTDVYRRLEKKDLSFAPQTAFDLTIPWEYQQMVPGDYQAEILVSNGIEEWKFDKKFTISAKESKVIAAEGDPVFTPKQDNSRWYWLVAGLSTVILGLVFSLVKNKKSQPMVQPIEIEAKRKKRKKIMSH